jgi:hypothetical protein
MKMVNGAGEGQRIRQWIQTVAVVLGGLVGNGAARAGPPDEYVGLRVLAVCAVSLQDGSEVCADTFFESRDYFDCTQQAELPIGNYGRGPGTVWWGNIVGGTFQQNGSAVYEWSGWRVVSWPNVVAVLGVDADVISRDGFDSHCAGGVF